MSEEKDNSFELPRSLYKEVKKMSREKMQSVLRNIYNQGVASAESTYVDLTDLRNAIGKINGIGEKRLDEIMAVIESFITGDDTE
ncbi:hypothetical protein [Ruminococcus albus]|uniref:Uncharacterized protein n=1 Tax=Ruminococcus albus (strain ATCC 27210 / DSM 20455 / JCM 14654 / NCDO 2250 / 7) TaxID=697329 RepID=E6UJI8_RUMA7|nr:hypothetical protein [Ruminococcus albus]ADU23834.1 hypothetical protein Rumal_3374 [Ruminococcus albus 7 = DSM 20455]